MTEIIADYAIAATQEQKYPALQADNYQPRNTKETINLCMAEQSVELLSSDTITALNFKPHAASFGEEEVTVFVPQADIGWSILSMPRLYLYDKETKQYSNLPAGIKLAGTKKVTAAKVFMCATVGGNLLLDNEGKPQVFTLNLKSSKTRLLKAQVPSPDDRTLYSLNAGLSKQHGVKGWIAHLATVDLYAVPEKFTSSVSGDTSLGVMFTLGTKIELLNPGNQRAVFDRIQDPDLQADMKDPYGLAIQQLQAMVIPEAELVF